MTLPGSYVRARDYLDRELIRLTPRRKDSAGKVAAARAFNAGLGDPQRAFPAVQVAGTSGKGSVCAWLASALEAAGYRAGLHVSPYLQVLSEKTVIGGRLCSVAQLADAVDAVRPAAERWRLDDECPASVHGLASLATSYVAFREAEIDVGVIETGLGGRFDLVQNLDRALSVITDLGLDHLKSLGPDLETIAWHKAGILERGVPAVAIRGAGQEVLAREADAIGCSLRWVDPTERVTGEGAATRIDVPGWGGCDAPGLEGFARRNAAVVAVSLGVLADAGWRVRPEHLAAALAGPTLPGRLERMPDGTILDGAHNAQKAAGLAGALEGDGYTVVLGATGHRPPADLLRALAPRCGRVIATEPRVYAKPAVPAGEVAAAAEALGLGAELEVSPERALERALAHGDPVLVTGSLYLVGALRERWYPSAEILAQRTCWPQ